MEKNELFTAKIKTDIYRNGNIGVLAKTGAVRLCKNKTRPLQTIQGRCGWSGFMHGR